MLQLLDSLKHCHMMGVIHRDLKPENILLESKENKIIKVADFGLAVEAQEGEFKWFGLAGTPNYMAPEVLEMKAYGRPVDIWACGVILYIMLAGYQPFYDNDERRLHTLIKTGDYELSSDTWKTVTAEGKDMIMKLLCVVPERRLTAAHALQHIWFQKVKTAKNHRQQTLDKLKDFNARRKFKAAVHSSILVSSFLTMSKKKREDATSQKSSDNSIAGSIKKGRGK
uniref:Protein kinase domain-containing protein n=1 Tax=Graphocephala atropunctata TaxID=36148 RepID=A0A1B6LZ43_9HEMI